MSKRNWVCFDCRSVVRREEYSAPKLMCATCSQPLVNLGYKIPIPLKARVKQWEMLREQHFASKRLAAHNRRRVLVRRKHALEKEIQRLQVRPANPERTRLMKALEKQLRELDA